MGDPSELFVYENVLADKPERPNKKKRKKKQFLQLDGAQVDKIISRFVSVSGV